MARLYSGTESSERTFVVGNVDVPAQIQRSLDVGIDDPGQRRDWFIEGVARACVDVGAVVRDLVGEKGTGVCMLRH